MGQKVHPTGIRLGIVKDWNSRWYANSQDYSVFLHQLIEVSMSGRDTQNDFDKFSMIADKLIGLGIKPTEGSKSEAGSGSELQDCVRSWQPADGKSSSTGG